MNLPLRAALASAAASPLAAVRSAAAVATAAAAGSVAYVRSWHPQQSEVAAPVVQPADGVRARHKGKAVKAGAEEDDGKTKKKKKKKKTKAQQAAAEAEAAEAAKAPFTLPRVVVEALCGAAGEIAQVGVLYPLETLKVRCQSDGMSVRNVLAAMVAAAGRAENAAAAAAAVASSASASSAAGLQQSRRVLAALYSGFGSAAALSVVVGAVHYASFCASKRLALAEGNGGGNGGGGGAGASAPAKAKKKGSSDKNAAAATADDSGGSAHGHGGGSNTAGANLAAASVGALVTALVESPAELFRHRAQAGTLGAAGSGPGGSVWRAMHEAVRLGGPGALFYGFGAYLMESVPYDVTELGVYGSLRDWIDERRKVLGAAAAAGKNDPSSPSAALVAATAAAPGGAGGASAALLAAAAVAAADARAEAGHADPGAASPKRRRRRRQQQQQQTEQEAAAQKASARPPKLAQLLSSWADGVVASAPAEALDLAAGAAAGTAAVFISMPLDVIKTYVQTHPQDAAQAADRVLSALPGYLQRNGVARFAAVGVDLARRGGGGALLAGLAPRLAQQVPSAMLCWLVLERCRAALEPFCAETVAPPAPAAA
jgi:hypothetical protein